MFAYDWDSDYEPEQPARATGGKRPACSEGPEALTALFFSDEVSDIESAKEVCSRCALVAECLEGALGRREPAGVWGGQLFCDGRVVARKRKRGRPSRASLAAESLVAIPGQRPPAVVRLSQHQERWTA